MSILSSAHVHTQYCDGKSTAAQMAQAAYARGFVSLGFSSHAPQKYDTCYCIDSGMENAYRREIQTLQKEYEGKMTIYLGIERDYYSSVSPDAYDYYIASVHHLPMGEKYPAVDGTPQEVQEYIDQACGGDGLLYVKRYYDLLQEYICNEKPPIIGHFDLVRKNNAKLHSFDETGPAYRKIALDALITMKESGALLEVNTGAIARGTLTTPYPDDFLLAAWRKIGGEVIVNSDCHLAEKIDVYYAESEELLRSLGYDHAVRLGKDTLWERFGL